MAHVTPVIEPVPESRLARNVLVAYDDSAGSRQALAYAAAIARASRGRLTIMTVVPPPPLAQPGLMAYYDPRATEAAMCTALRHAAESVPQDVPLTTVVGHGHPAAEIVRRAEEGNHDLVVLGCEGRGPFKGTMTGVCPRVLRHCKAPMLVIHAGAEEG
jgi:nucleotide-binding universal stress UspA family protein